MKKTFSIVYILILAVLTLTASDPAYYLGRETRFDPDIPTPKQVMGYNVGDWHVRHDQLLDYMKTVAEASDRVKLEVIGQTHEQRQLVHLTITSPDNHARLDEIRQQHRELALNGNTSVPLEQMPVVVCLGYSVHGNEPSGSNAALMMAYFLAATEGIDELLNNTVIILDPCLNPDGLSRFAQWANMHKGNRLMADSNHREHREEWPSGRTNHYWFDLNRDWLLLQHPESRARVKRFHYWLPNILTDHHEMGTDSTFFFQPGIPSRQNPITPTETLDMTRLIGRYHAEALDQAGELYYSEQNFDDFYYGKGSTYPDIQGCIGILFEQASSRGHLQNNSYGQLTFPETIRNQVTTSMSTLKAALENRVKLLEYQQGFYKKSMDDAKADKVKAYVFGTGSDPVRSYEMARVLQQHQVELYQLARPIAKEGVSIDQGYVVPLNQRQYRLLKSVFEPMTTFPDQTFYDVSTWHFPSAWRADYLALDQRSFSSNLMGDRITEPVFPSTDFETEGQNIAYILDWRSFYSPRAAKRLLEAGVRVRYAKQTFTANTTAGKQAFGLGTLMVPMGIQTLEEKRIIELLKTIAEKDGVRIYATRTGLTPEGIDLGSPSMAELRMPKPLLLVGGRVSQYGAGELWHLLDNRFEMPVTVANKDRLDRMDLSGYTHLLAARGLSLSESGSKKVAQWVRDGGILIALQDTSILQQTGLLKLTPRSNKNGDEKKFLPHGDRSQHRALQMISGSIFQGIADLTHPLCYGIEKDRIPLFRSGNKFVEPSPDPYGTVIRYSATPLISGYVSIENLEKAKGSAAIIAQGVGAKRGAVVMMMDNPNFRGFWYGGNRLLLNGLFFGSAISQGRMGR